MANAPHDSEPSKSYGWRLLETRCRSCHALPDPRTHTRERWVKGIDQMRRRFTLADADWDSLLALVPSDTSQPGPGANPAAPSPGTTR